MTDLIAGRTLAEWQEFARRDDCLERMMPSDLRLLVGRILADGWEIERMAKAGPFIGTHRHVKRGTIYAHLGTARIQSDEPLGDMDPVEVYIGEDSDLWARRQSEFHDGRFAALAAPDEALSTATDRDE